MSEPTNIPSNQKIAAEVVRNVCELPDYNSPENQPDLVMCTVQELENCVLKALEGSAVETSTVQIPRELAESLAWEHRDGSKLTLAINELRALLKSPVKASEDGNFIIGASGERYWKCSCKPPGDINIASVSVCKDCGTVRPAQNGLADSGKP